MDIIMTAGTPCRTYIVYQHALFAEGVRSVLEAQNGVQIVGMESNVGKALKAVRSLRPAVVLLEEPTGKNGQWPFLQLATAGRLVTLSLDHGFATVYDQHRISASDPADLVMAIRGAGKRKQPPGPGPGPQQDKTAKGFRSPVGCNGVEDQSGRGSRARHARKEDQKQTETISRTTRARKGG